MKGGGRQVSLPFPSLLCLLDRLLVRESAALVFPKPEKKEEEEEEERGGGWSFLRQVRK